MAIDPPVSSSGSSSLDTDDCNVSSLELMTETEFDMLIAGLGDSHIPHTAAPLLEAFGTLHRHGTRSSASPGSSNAQLTPTSTFSGLVSGNESNQAADGSGEDAFLYSNSSSDGYTHFSPHDSQSSGYSESRTGPPGRTEQSFYYRTARDLSVAPAHITGPATRSLFTNTNEMDHEALMQYDADTPSTADNIAFSSSVPYDESLLAGMNGAPELDLTYQPPHYPGCWSVNHAQQAYLAVTQPPQQFQPSWGAIQPSAQHVVPVSTPQQSVYYAAPGAVQYAAITPLYQHVPQPIPQYHNVPQPIPHNAYYGQYERTPQAPQLLYEPQVQIFPGVGPAPQTDLLQPSLTHPSETRVAPVTMPATRRQAVGPARLSPRTLAAAIHPRGAAANHAHPRDGDAPKRTKGGRKKGKPLSAAARQKSCATRKAVACWRCKLQRDPCEPGDDESKPCKRCERSTGPPCAFGCVRSKLPDFIFDILPPSMTLMHQKQTIEDCVQDQVVQWYHLRPVEVNLTSGYGCPLV
jgi:hypothetical protein